MARSCGTTTMFARWLILTLVAVLTSAFSPVSPRPPRSVVSRRFDSCTSLSATSSSSRRDVLVGGFMAAVAAGWGNPRIVAAVDDLTMPTEEDQRKIDEAAAMAAKLKRKAELQKQAARPQSFGENFKGEIQKQKEFGQQTKEERRAAMCEELGRGC